MWLRERLSWTEPSLPCTFLTRPSRPPRAAPGAGEAHALGTGDRFVALFPCPRSQPHLRLRMWPPACRRVLVLGAPSGAVLVSCVSVENSEWQGGKERSAGQPLPGSSSSFLFCFYSVTPFLVLFPDSKRKTPSPQRPRPRPPVVGDLFVFLIG